MSATEPKAGSAAILTARYIAIRTAEAKGLGERLFEASRDRTPGVRRFLAPILFRYWVDNREEGWAILQRIAEGAVRFPGLVDREALELFGEVSMPILNASRHDDRQLGRLGRIWQAQMTALFESPLAKASRLLARRWVLKAGANALGEVMKRQPKYQPVNYRELEITFGRPDSFRAHWREALACLERPEAGTAPIERILSDTSLPFDLYLMLACERALIFQGVRGDTRATIDLVERIFYGGCSWFGQSALYVLSHVIGQQAEVEDAWLDRYGAMAQAFFTSGRSELETEAGAYDFAPIIANPDVVAARLRPDRPPQVVPALLERAIASGSAKELGRLFTAIDGVAFYHGNGALALLLIERAYELGGKSIEGRVVASLASVRLQNQALVDTFIAQHRLFAGIDPAYVAAAEPSVGEEDFLTLVDGFVIHMLLNSDRFRGALCAAFARALPVRTVEDFLFQLLEWVRDELRALPQSFPDRSGG